MPEPQQHHIWAMSRTYTTAHGKARSSTHWVRPGINLATSWLLVGSASAVPRWELQQLHAFKIKDNALENALEKKWPKHLSRHFINDQGKGNEYETTSVGELPPQTILCKPQNFYTIKRIHTNLKYLDIPPILPVGSKKRAIQSDFLKPNMLLGDYVTGLW